MANSSVFFFCLETIIFSIFSHFLIFFAPIWLSRWFFLWANRRLGDSRCVLGDGNPVKARAVTQDHRPSVGVPGGHQGMGRMRRRESFLFFLFVFILLFFVFLLGVFFFFLLFVG